MSNLSHEARKTLLQRRELIARSIITTNANTKWRYAPDTDGRHRQYVQELQKINAALDGTGDADSAMLAESMAENIRYRSAFVDWLRKGSDMSHESRRNLAQYRATLATEGTPLQAAYPGSTSGFLVPVSFWHEVVSSSKSVGPFWADDFCTVHITETGAPLSIPSDADLTTNSAAILNEGGVFANPTFPIGQNVLGTYKFTSAVVLSDEFAQDTGIELDSYLAKRLGKRAQLGLLPYLTNGTGSGQPAGVLNGLTASLTAVGAGSNDGTSGANTIGTDDVANLINSLDPSFAANGSFMMNLSTLTALRKVRTSRGGLFLTAWCPTIIQHS